MSMNKVLIIGRLGGDPVMKYTPAGKPFTSFSVATSERRMVPKEEDGNSNMAPIEETIWWRVSAFGRQAETCNQYLKKGAEVFVEGKMRGDASGGPRIWTANDGTPRASFEVNALDVRFIGSKGKSSGGDEESAGDDIPI